MDSRLTNRMPYGHHPSDTPRWANLSPIKFIMLMTKKACEDLNLDKVKVTPHEKTLLMAALDLALRRSLVMDKSLVVNKTYLTKEDEDMTAFIALMEKWQKAALKFLLRIKKAKGDDFFKNLINNSELIKQLIMQDNIRKPDKYFDGLFHKYCKTPEPSSDPQPDEKNSNAENEGV